MQPAGTWLIEPDDRYIDRIAVEKALAGQRVGLTRTERVEVARLLAADGHTVVQIQYRLGIGPSTARSLLTEAEHMAVA